MHRKPKVQIGASILNADLSNLAEECRKLVDNGADYLHLDVMDGTFVPNITFGAPVVKCLKQKIPGTFLDMHMMVSSPIQWIKDIKEAGGSQYTFHYEAANENVSDVIQNIRDSNMLVGLAIKPKTDVKLLLPYIDKVDMVLIMTVEPGFGGQSFMTDMMPKVKYLRERYPYIDIEVDGGVGIKTIEDCAKAGANMIVSGTAITGSKDPKSTMENLRRICTSHFYNQIMQ